MPILLAEPKGLNNAGMFLPTTCSKSNVDEAGLREAFFDLIDDFHKF
jgi:hypothetical protein